MRVLTYKLYKEHYDIYTEIQGSIEIKLAQKDIVLLSKASTVIYKSGKRTGVENTKFTHFNLSAGTYSIDDFNPKVKEFVLQWRKDWEPPKIKDLKLFIREDDTFKASNHIFIALGIQDNYFENTTLIRSTLPAGSYKTFLDTSPPPNILSFHCK